MANQNNMNQENQQSSKIPSKEQNLEKSSRTDQSMPGSSSSDKFKSPSQGSVEDDSEEQAP